MIDTDAEFLMEVTDKTKADVKVCTSYSSDLFVYNRERTTE
jgi:UDP-N-acetylglucosamine pyrophosphorylase